jgi:hypothetical protein
MPVVSSCQNNLNTCTTAAAEHNDVVSPCDYIKRIEALLVYYIHALHLSAISRLSPASATMKLHHVVVVEGYLKIHSRTLSPTSSSM